MEMVSPLPGRVRPKSKVKESSYVCFRNRPPPVEVFVKRGPPRRRNSPAFAYLRPRKDISRIECLGHEPRFLPNPIRVNLKQSRSV